MKDNRRFFAGLAAPNLVNVCVDRISNGDISGKLFQCYSLEPTEFLNVVQLVKLLEDFYDTISFPQESVKIRSFVEHVNHVRPAEAKRKLLDQERILQYRGKIRTFLIHVQYRQNATWQGNLICEEEDKAWQFFSELELLKLIDNALEDCD